MEKGMCKEFLKILLDIQNEYTENDKESVTTSEVIFAAFKFFSLEKEEWVNAAQRYLRL